MIDWRLTQRSERERRVAFAGVVAGIPLAIWLLVWQPLLDWRAAAEQDYQSKRQTLEWMHAAAARIESYRQSGQAAATLSAGSPEQLITRAAASLGLSIARIEPTADNRFNVFFGSAGYRVFLRFVDQLQREGMVVESLTMGQLPQPGEVSVRMTLGSSR